MAEIVAAFGVPHAPQYPAQVARDGPASPIAQNFAELRSALEAVAPDAIVFFDSDHLHTFFFDNFPTFAVGLGTRTAGPNDRTPMPGYDVPVDDVLARHIRRHGIADDFDLAMAQGFTLDHSIMVPLHFLTPAMRVPIVPIFVNGFAPPVPSARRCFALGESVRAAIAAHPADARVCWRVVHDPAFHDAIERDPAAALADAELTPEERALLLAGEVGRLYAHGAHPFLLQLLAINGVPGLTADTYSERMRAVAQVDTTMLPGY